MEFASRKCEYGFKARDGKPLVQVAEYNPNAGDANELRKLAGIFGMRK